MPEKQWEPSQDMHSEEWWIRVLDNELTASERVRWDAHLATCQSCREELSVFARVDTAMAQPPPVPALSVDFTATTVRMVTNRQRWRRLLAFVAGALIVGVAGLLVAGVVDSLFLSFGQGMGAVFSARNVLFRSMVQTALGLLERWRTIIPYTLGTALLAYAVVMPNGLLMTFALVWLSSRRRARATVPA